MPVVKLTDIEYEACLRIIFQTHDERVIDAFTTQQWRNGIEDSYISLKGLTFIEKILLMRAPKQIEGEPCQMSVP